MANKDRLVGSDATLYKGTVSGNPVATGAMVAGGIYKIATISGTTVFASGYEVGDLVLGDPAKTLSSTNSAYLVSTSEALDVTEFSVDLSAAEIEVTTLSDDVSKYRKGKTDLSGSMSGINFISEMKKDGSFLNRFLRTVTTTSAYSLSGSVNTVDESELIGVFYLQKDAATTGETMAVMLASIELFGYKAGGTIADAQTWESGFRVTGNDPIVFFRPNT